MRRGTCGALIVAVAAVAGCGGGSSSSQGNGTCNPGQSTSVGIAAAGVTPKAVCVQPGGTVTFTNNDTVNSHLVAFAAPCAALSLQSPINPTQSDTVQFPTSAVCAFDADSAHPGNAAFQGTVAVTTTPPSGPGY